MSTYLLFGNYCSEGFSKVADRHASRILETVTDFGGKARAMYALLGAFDCAMIVDFPAIEDAMKFSVVMAQSFGVSFQTMPIIPVEE
ncbi:GYD domain-containing protein, partial [Candidatus Saccharibacteria bacterium]|nr:GYD domain-containing protein [Calditrichia bacterium]NIW00005.1 GYD domain-containing protein [Candidatus Saccharibacteria bacterium]